jgi:hypothetical protein
MPPTFFSPNDRGIPVNIWAVRRELTAAPPSANPVPDGADGNVP